MLNPTANASNAPPTIVMVAGEKSGDILAANLIAAVRQRCPQAKFAGIGGPAMAAEGFECWHPMEQLSVSGYSEVVRSLPKLLLLRRNFIKQTRALSPQLFIGVDAPDFNLTIERHLKADGIKTIHYISPSIWAWRGERIKLIKSAADHVLTLLPMEKELYDNAGIPATYVGHPFADEIPMETERQVAAEKLGIPPHQIIYTFLPGSREQEVAKMAPLMIETAKSLLATQPEAKFLVPLITRPTMDLFYQLLYKHNAQELPIRVMFGHPRQAMGAAHSVLVASGTATLEAALIKRPMVITYRLSPFSYKIMRKKAYLPYVGLPNILAGRFIVPEFIQDEATPDNLALALLNSLREPALQAFYQTNFKQIHQELKQNSAQKAAEVVASYL